MAEFLGRVILREGGGRQRGCGGNGGNRLQKIATRSVLSWSWARMICQTAKGFNPRCVAATVSVAASGVPPMAFGAEGILKLFVVLLRSVWSAGRRSVRGDARNPHSLRCGYIDHDAVEVFQKLAQAGNGKPLVVAMNPIGVFFRSQAADAVTLHSLGAKLS